VHLEAAVADGLYLVWYVVAVAADGDLEAALAGLAGVDCELALLVDDAVGYVQHLDSLRIVGLYFEGCSLLSLGGKGIITRFHKKNRKIFVSSLGKPQGSLQIRKQTNLKR